MRWNDLEKEPCSVARTLSVIGDRWTLMVLRDCFLGLKRFDDFQDDLGISRTILRDRLNHLVEHGVLKRHQYEDRPRRFEYRLTRKGVDLQPVMMTLLHWGNTHMVEDGERPLLQKHKICGHDFDPVLSCSVCGDPVTPYDVAVRPGPGAGPRGQMMAADH